MPKYLCNGFFCALVCQSSFLCKSGKFKSHVGNIFLFSEVLLQFHKTFHFVANKIQLSRNLSLSPQRQYNDIPRIINFQHHSVQQFYYEFMKPFTWLQTKFNCHKTFHCLRKGCIIVFQELGNFKHHSVDAAVASAFQPTYLQIPFAFISRQLVTDCVNIINPSFQTNI